MPFVHGNRYFCFGIHLRGHFLVSSFFRTQRILQENISALQRSFSVTANVAGVLEKRIHDMIYHQLEV